MTLVYVLLLSVLAAVLVCTAAIWTLYNFLRNAWFETSFGNRPSYLDEE